MDKVKQKIRMVLLVAAILAAVLIIAGARLDGYFSIGAYVLSVLPALAAILLFSVALTARFHPVLLSKLFNKFVQRGELPDAKHPNKVSEDWEQWFANQAEEGWKVDIKENHKTPWTDDVDPENVLPEYPRPQLVRERWLNLNGLWQFNVLPKEIDVVSSFPGKVLVPYPVESALSGVGRPIYGGEKIWYKRTFTIPETWREERIVLNFGAVDWQAKVFVNDQLQVEHTGGYTPFSADITDAVNMEGENEIVVVVYDPTDSNERKDEARQKGKQTLCPADISYTPSSGIWQTVWIEPVSDCRVESVIANSNIKSGYAVIEAKTNIRTAGIKARITTLCDGQEFIGEPDTPITVLVEEKKLWTPENPYLYNIKVELLDGDKVIDSVNSYFALREVGKKRINGEVVLTLNGKPVFHHGPLDQGFWPDGLYTHSSDKALAFDIEQMKAMGFNMARKHIKVECARWYYHADRLGLMVWQDMPSAGSFTSGSYSMWLDYIQYLAPFGTRHVTVRDNDYEGWNRTENSRAQFYKELEEMIDALYVNPSVVCWIPFNENWGQFDAVAVTDFVKNKDATRLINNVSGEQDQNVGDIYDCHIYMQDLWLPVDPANFRASVIGEYGGKTWKVQEEAWSDGKIFSYGSTESIEDFRNQYKELMVREVKPLVKKGLAASVYTQITDVEGEINGLITYNRKVVKVIPEAMKETHQELYNAFNGRLLSPEAANAPCQALGNTLNERLS